MEIENRDKKEQDGEKKTKLKYANKKCLNLNYLSVIKLMVLYVLSLVCQAQEKH
jgi:hypothetical protein